MPLSHGYVVVARMFGHDDYEALRTISSYASLSPRDDEVDAAELARRYEQYLRALGASDYTKDCAVELRLHRESGKFVEDFLENNRGKTSVVLTHHAPSRRAIGHHHATDITSAAFASDLEPLISERGPKLWVHGHTHQRHDYRIRKTRIVCNPRGYPDEPSFHAFDFSFVVEI